MKLQAFNQLEQVKRRQHLYQCCSSDNWAQKLSFQAPFASLQALKVLADEAFSQLEQDDVLQAFAGHPKIGDIQSLKAKYAQTKALAAGEQSGVQQADETTLIALAQANQEYQARFGFIFIVCATGKTAAQMLEILLARLSNSHEQEIVEASEQQRQIMQIRLDKLIQEADSL